MDWLTFFAKLIEAGVWPAVALVVFFQLKDELSELVPFLQRLKYKDFVVEFGKDIRELREETQAKIPETPTEALPSPTPRTLREHLEILAELAPRSAILEAWLQVEYAAQQIIRDRKLTDKSLKLAGPKRLQQYLEEAEILTTVDREIFTRLRELRNKAVHGPEVRLPVDEVLMYIEAALSFAAHLGKKGKP